MSRILIARGGAAALILAAALVVSACSSSGGAASGTPATAAGSAAPSLASSVAPSAAPSVEPSVVASAEPSATAAPSPSSAAVTPAPEPSVAASIDPFAGLNRDLDLEARLPDSFGGAKLMKLSFSGKDFPADPDTTEYLGAIGKSYDDLSMAVASSEGGDPVFIAMRVKGASEGDLKKLSEATVDGVAVLKSTDTDTGTVAYFVVRGDTALGVSGKSEASARKAFATLVK
jgi:hypothetical protein